MKSNKVVVIKSPKLKSLKVNQLRRFIFGSMAESLNVQYQWAYLLQQQNSNKNYTTHQNYYASLSGM